MQHFSFSELQNNFLIPPPYINIPHLITIIPTALFQWSFLRNMSYWHFVKGLECYVDALNEVKVFSYLYNAIQQRGFKTFDNNALETEQALKKYQIKKANIIPTLQEKTT